MPKNCYPSPATAPLELSEASEAGCDSGLLPFTLAGSPSAGDKIYIRIAVSDPACLSATGPLP